MILPAFLHKTQEMPFKPMMNYFTNCKWSFYARLLFFTVSLQPATLKAQQWADHFRPLPPCDTLHVEISMTEDSAATHDTIPNRVFFSLLPPGMLQEIDYVVDSSGAVVFGRYHFPLNDSIEAYWVETRYSWFHHHSLLVYDKHKKTFTGRVTLAEFYGGEGGQVLTGSWVFDFDGDGDPDIVRREIQHSVVPYGDDVLERTEESASLLMWENGQFTDAQFQDIGELVRRFPISTFW